MVEILGSLQLNEEVNKWGEKVLEKSNKASKQACIVHTKMPLNIGFDFYNHHNYFYQNEGEDMEFDYRIGGG